MSQQVLVISGRPRGPLAQATADLILKHISDSEVLMSTDAAEPAIITPEEARASGKTLEEYARDSFEETAAVDPEGPEEAPAEEAPAEDLSDQPQQQQQRPTMSLEELLEMVPQTLTKGMAMRAASLLSDEDLDTLLDMSEERGENEDARRFLVRRQLKRLVEREIDRSAKQIMDYEEHTGRPIEEAAQPETGPPEPSSEN